MKGQQVYEVMHNIYDSNTLYISLDIVNPVYRFGHNERQHYYLSIWPNGFCNGDWDVLESFGVEGDPDYILSIPGMGMEILTDKIRSISVITKDGKTQRFDSLE